MSRLPEYTIHPVPEKGAYEGFLRRPTEQNTILSWITTIDHKRIGILYGVTALLWFIVGGCEALAIRTQLAFPEQRLYSAELYNQLFTMHGTTMIFLVVMPLSVAFFNFLIPLQIGARDVAFPRLNAFSYWMFLFGSLLVNFGWFTGEAPNGGWFGYAPNTLNAYNPGLGIDFWVLGLQVLGVSSVAGALNFAATIINMRAPGMSMWRLPVFSWMTLVTSFLLFMAFPSITIALVELLFDRYAGTNFFAVAKGGLPIVWQHLFWVFGHPEVYILILPAMGVVSEILPVFSRRPLFGYPLVVASGMAIGFMGFTVWAHHMFTTGLGNVANAAFAVTTMAIAVPTGVKIFNWVLTLWGGQIRLKAPMMFAMGFLTMFMIGGFSGLMHANPAHDSQQQDTYFIVAHFHYVLIGGAVMGLFGGLYFWFPKLTGKMLTESTGHIVFWGLFAGFNLTFFPMHWLGLNGMPRRIYTYAEGMGWDELNLLCTLGAFLMAASVGLFYFDVVKTLLYGEPCGHDPWDARTLEWSIPSPVPVYNFKEIPHVKDLDDWWVTKHPQLLHHQEEAPAAHDDHHHHDDHGIHIPGASWFPLFSAIGFAIAGFSMIFQPVLAILGAIIAIISIFCWSLEPIGGYYIHFEDEH